MSITTYYRVEIEIPEDVWTNFGHTAEYSNMVHNAIYGFVDAGSDAYCEVCEWATFRSRHAAERCERRLLEVVQCFQKKLKEENHA